MLQAPQPSRVQPSQVKQEAAPRAAAAAASTSPALAKSEVTASARQQAASEMDEVQITGTRIERPASASFAGPDHHHQLRGYAPTGHRQCGRRAHATGAAEHHHGASSRLARSCGLRSGCRGCSRDRPQCRIHRQHHRQSPRARSRLRHPHPDAGRWPARGIDFEPGRCGGPERHSGPTCCSAWMW